LFAVGAILGWAQAPAAPQPVQFEVVSIKLDPPNSFGTKFGPKGTPTFRAENVSLWGLIGIAYGVSDMQVAGLPNWNQSTRYDVIAKAGGEKALDDEQFKVAMQLMLKDRMHLEVHHEKRMVDGYRLVTDKQTPKLSPGEGEGNSRVYLDDQGLDAANTTLSHLCSALVYKLGFPVEDDTGIKGSYKITLKFANEGDGDSSLPSIFTAVKEQLGLRLERAKVPLDMIVIDHVDREPTEN